MRQESNRREFQRLRLTLIQTSTSLKKTEFLRKILKKVKAAEAALKQKNQTGEFSPSKTEGKSRKSILVFWTFSLMGRTLWSGSLWTKESSNA